MKEILFRGRTASGKWFYGNYEHYHKPEKNLISDIYTREPQDVLLETVGLFTGLTDKNGKKVFEGDIVRWNINFAIVYQDCQFALKKDIEQVPIALTLASFNNGELEVIGNVFDNPELMRQSK